MSPAQLAIAILGLFEPLFAIASRCGVGLFLKGGIKRRNGIKSALIGNVGNVQLGLVDKELFSFLYPKSVDVAIKVAIETTINKLG